MWPRFEFYWSFVLIDCPCIVTLQTSIQIINCNMRSGSCGTAFVALCYRLGAAFSIIYTAQWTQECLLLLLSLYVGDSLEVHQ